MTDEDLKRQQAEEGTPRPPVEGDDPGDRVNPSAPRNIEQATETAEPRASVRRKDVKAVHAAAEKLLGELDNVQNGDLVGEIVATALKLLRDQTNRGDIKLIDNSFRELRYALKVFAPYRDFRKVSIFGSARTPETHPDYKLAAEYGEAMAAAGWMVITGAGGGIMAAGHGGAGAKGSFGLNISLPFEQSANEFIHGDPKLIDFKYFFTRKLMFLRSSHAVTLFPGGFGTMDEGFEVMTLIQTGKCPPLPLIMVDRPGGDYWAAWDRYVRDHLLANKLISPEDLSLYKITNRVDEAVEETLKFYRNYHSLRYFRDLLILRLQKRPTESQMDRIKGEFGDIVAGGGDWRCCGALKIERNERKLRNLHRIVFPFNRRDHGRLRQLIDHLNTLDA